MPIFLSFTDVIYANSYSNSFHFKLYSDCWIFVFSAFSPLTKIVIAFAKKKKKKIILFLLPMLQIPYSNLFYISCSTVLAFSVSSDWGLLFKSCEWLSLICQKKYFSQTTTDVSFHYIYILDNCIWQLSLSCWWSTASQAMNGLSGSTYETYQVL